MLLWRIESCPTSIRIGPTLAEDLALHLRYAPLTTVLAQIGSQQQAYVSTPGCPGCRHRRCTPDCRMNLLRRILVADHVAADLRPIPLGLSTRPYTRLVLAVPGPRARPLDADVLTPWRDARVWAVWRMVLGQQVVGAALAVGAEGPEPLAALRERGWLGIVAPQPLVRQAHQPEPLALPYGWRWTTPAHMLLPRRLATAPSATTEPDHEPIITPAPADAGVALHTIADAPAIPFMVAGQVMGVLTAALVAQALAALATIEQRLLAPKPLMTPTQIRDPETRDPAASPASRTRPERRWAIRVATAAQEGVEDAEDALPLSDVIAAGEITEDELTLPIVIAAGEVAETSSASHTEPLPTLPADPDSDATSAVIPAEAPPQALMDSMPVVAAEPISGASVEAPAAPIRWVAGPTMTADEVASLMQAIVQTESFFTGRPGQYGLSIRMMKELFTLGRADAEPLLAWLDAAELVTAPSDHSKPWLRPRPLITRDLTVIAARLAATPLPTESITASFKK